MKYHDDADVRRGDGRVARAHRDPVRVGRATRTVDLWTGCYTPRELRLLLGAHGFVVDSIASVEPGAYGADAPTVESPEFLVLATRRDIAGRA